MDSNKLKKILIRDLLLEEVYVFSDVKNYRIIAVSYVFCNMSKLERHKIIYAPLMQYILSNEIHSISIEAFSPEEWEANRHLYNV